MSKTIHKNFFAPRAKGLGGASVRRAAFTLLMMLLTTMTAWADNITYIDENGQTQTVDATQITSDNRKLYSGTWYYVSGTVNCPDDYLYLMQENDTHKLILCDGATLTLKKIEQNQNKFARLKVYGQSAGTGKLNVGDGNTVNAIFNCELTVNGGEVTLTGGNTGLGCGTNHNVIFNGGKLTATGGDKGIGGNTTINATSGWIKAKNYGGSVTIAEGKYMKDETGRFYKGTLTDAEKTAAAGKTLQPATETEYINCMFGGGDGSQNNPYVISATKGWNCFCKQLESGESFSGKYVKLGANISITRMAGSSDHEFCGTFDGDHKTLTFNYGSADTPSTDDYIAPFRYVSGATISSLHVSGNIYTSHTHAGGIIGLASGTTNVSDCRSSVNIVSSINGDGTHGGLIACTWTGSTTNIEGCLFDGSIQSASGFVTNCCGGFVGWRNNTVNVTNCLLTADLSTIGASDSYTFVRRAVSTITNSYYSQALGTTQGIAAHSITAGEYVTVGHAGVATEYTTSGITAYKATDAFIAGLVYNNVIYAGNGEQVSLTLAHSDRNGEGYDFESYTASSGTLTGNEADGYTLTMADGDVAISANYTFIPALLEYQGMTWDGSFTSGQTLTLTAKFKNTGRYEATNAVATMTSTSDYVTINNSPINVGTIAVGQEVSCQFNVTIAETCPESERIPVTFTLTADDDLSVQGTETLKNACNVIFNLSDYYGDGWNGANLIVSFDDGTASQSLTIPSNNSSATYPLMIGNGTHVTLTWSSGSYDGECSFTVSYGEDALFYSQTSEPSAGVLYEFDCNCAAASQTFTITATSSNTEQGTVSGGGEFGFGQSCTVTATPAEGYMFIGWTMNGKIVSTAASYTFTVYSDMDLVANFADMIGGGYATNNYLPTYNKYKYSLTEQIYTSAEMGEAGLITSIAFYNGGAEKTRTLDLYMKNTDKSSFSGNTDWIAVSASDKVFSSSVTFAADAWTFITFSTPFIYDGKSNVVLVTDDNSSEISIQPHMACRVFDAANQALYVYFDYTNYDPTTPSSYTGTVLSVKNQLLITKEVIPTESVNITVSVSPAQAGTVSGGGEYAFGDVCTVSVTPNEGYIFTGWKKNGVLVSNDLELSFKATADRDLVATFVQGIEIGEFTANNIHLPSYNYYNYSLTQQIYTAEEIGDAAGTINWIAFYNEGAEKTRTYDLYLKATEKTAFSSNDDWIAVAETDKVFSGSVTMSVGAWTIIHFTTPFEYDGTSNLVLVVDDNTNAYSGSPHMACSVFNTDKNQAIYIHNDNTNPDPMSPPEASTNNDVLSVKNHILLGILTNIYLVDEGDNSETIRDAADGRVYNVILQGRKLWKDGDWNTLCLPFSVDDFTGTPLAGATVMELGNINCNTGFDAATGTLNLEFVEADEIEAGHAYIVKWNATTPNYIENPVFNGVTIVNESPADQSVESSDGYVTFLGSGYKSLNIYTADKTNLYLGADNKLYYPWSEGMTEFYVGPFRAYFRLNNGLSCGDPDSGVRGFNINFGGEQTGILSTTNLTNFTNNADWYSLDGRKLQGKPTKKGIYIHAGRRVVIK